VGEYNAGEYNAGEYNAGEKVKYSSPRYILLQYREIMKTAWILQVDYVGQRCIKLPMHH